MGGLLWVSGVLGMVGLGWVVRCVRLGCEVRFGVGCYGWFGFWADCLGFVVFCGVDII